MVQKYKILLIIFSCLFMPIAISEDNTNFKNISIQADQVILNENMNQLEFKNNIKIQIDGFIIRGAVALLSYRDEKLEISGIPASIKSHNIDGNAELFVALSTSGDPGAGATFNDTNPTISHTSGDLFMRFKLVEPVDSAPFSAEDLTITFNNTGGSATFTDTSLQINAKIEER